MAGRTLDLANVLIPDQMAMQIIDTFMEWNMMRSKKRSQWQEIRNYVYATDTTTTGNASLPWKNKTTIPKLTQIADNLYANYLATLFPKAQWFIWQGMTEEDQAKASTIEKYMRYVVSQQPFKEEIEKLLIDYIINGNCIVTPEWSDYRQQLKDSTKVGYVGPTARRISPDDIVFNPLAPSFRESPKVIRSLITLGDLKKEMDKQSGDSDELAEATQLYDYFKNIRQQVFNHSGDYQNRNAAYAVDGFTNFESYLKSGYIEILTFHGDLYNIHTGEFLENFVITVADRHKIVGKRPNASWFGYPPIFHAGWRTRQDNLWAMGALDNLVGIQYRIDHLENLKADCYDLTAFPPLMIKGYVEDFTWGPMSRIHVQDDGDVKILSPDVNVLNTNSEITMLSNTMEEMAGAPKEAMGFRTPGEKTKYEVQRLENAAARIFQSKISQFEEKILEPLLNAMLEMAKRLMDSSVIISSLNDQYNVVEFQSLTKEDITGSGTIRPMAARNFAQKAETVQNLTNFFGSSIGQDPLVAVHWSGIKIAKMMENLLELQDYALVQENVRISEQAEIQQLQQTAQEQTMMHAQTPAGIAPDDSDPDLGTAGGPTGKMPQPPTPGLPNGN